ncbi:MAG: magnesium transporter [Epulopiscium sp. Nele67-Bin005]|nr:MAG: magnesium transporter [Epulopiscium sp. Nele67-Bin005]
MVNIYKSNKTHLIKINKFEEGCWINVIKPTDEEIKNLSQMCNIEEPALILALDEEEKAHIEVEDKHTVIVVDVAVKDSEGVHEFVTIPLGIILSEHFIITVCLREVDLLKDFLTNQVKTFFTYKKTRFILQLLYKNASYYLHYLRYIDRVSNKVEQQLRENMNNKDLLYLLELEKSLVYFTTALRANEIVLEKMMRMEKIKQYKEDRELLEDVIIENKQAMEMASVYSNILSETRDAFSSVISNNLNTVMQTLTSITIILALPTMIFSFFGMNVPLPWEQNPLGYIYITFSSVICIFIGSYFIFKNF